MEAAALAREYYDAIDSGDYKRLGNLLADGFIHERPDRIIEGREAFVQFMRDERPDKNTTHEVNAVYAGRDGRVAIQGRLRRADGEEWFTFVDTFSVDGGTVGRITTYART